MTALAAAQTFLRRLVDAAPVAWRYDPIFRGTTVGAGVTLLLFLLRAVGPRAPELESSELRYTPPALREFMPRPGASPLAVQPPAEVPTIAPGRSLSDVTVTPTFDGDRFGTFKP